MAARPNEEQGFVLIGAIWLLILCGAIASILTLRAVSAYRAADVAERELADRLALDAGFETIVAELLIKGQGSRWAVLPVESSLLGDDGRALKVRITSELGRLDINEAAPEAVDGVLRELGLEAAERGRILGSLALSGSEEEGISSFEELGAVFAAAAPAHSICLEREFTLFSGLTRPQRLSAPAPIAPGTPLRIELRLPEGAALTAWLRITGLLNQPYSVLAYRRQPVCG